MVEKSNVFLEGKWWLRVCGATWYLYLAHVFEKYADFVEAYNLYKNIKNYWKN